VSRKIPDTRKEEYHPSLKGRFIMPANGERSWRFLIGKTFFILLTLTIIGFGQCILAYASVNGFSTIIPLEKGNAWKYSYDIQQTFEIAGDTTFTTGLLSLTVDSVALFPGLNDTTFFRLAITDSGTIRDTVSSPYLLNYSKNYYVYNDTLFSLDSNTSPGFDSNLLSYNRLRDTVEIILGYYIGSFTSKTDSVSVMIENQQYGVLSATTHNGLVHAGMSVAERKTTDVSVQWIPRIGTAYYHYFYDYTYGFVGSSISRTYTLQTFNGMVIPPIPISAVRTDLLKRKTLIPFVKIKKIVYLKQSSSDGIRISKKTFFSLQGQKLNRPIGGKLLVEKKAVHP
jgi:hypothetical protein